MLCALFLPLASEHLTDTRWVELIVGFSVLMLYVHVKEDSLENLHVLSCFVQLKKRSFNLLCVLDPNSKRQLAVCRLFAKYWEKQIENVHDIHKGGHSQSQWLDTSSCTVWSRCPSLSDKNVNALHSLLLRVVELFGLSTHSKASGFLLKSWNSATQEVHMYGICCSKPFFFFLLALVVWDDSLRIFQQEITIHRQGFSA